MHSIHGILMTILSNILFYTDMNCVQIIAPKNTAAVHPATYYLGERIGNVSRNVAAVPSELMDVRCPQLDECNEYSVDYVFRCILLEDSTHRSSGFLVKIIVYSVNSDLWTQKLFDILKEKGTKPTKISQTILLLLE